MKLPPRKYIYRRESSRAALWTVDFRKRGRYNKHRFYPMKNFSDSVYGGREKSLKAARAWRDAEFKTLLKHLGWKRIQKRMHDNSPHQRKTRRWPSPEFGVSLFYTRGRPPFWRASWPGGKRVFGVLSWGYLAGYRNAMECRRKMTGIAINIPPIPPAPPMPLDVRAYLDGITLEQLRRAKRMRKKRRKKK